MNRFSTTNALIDLRAKAARAGLKIETHNPGDGIRIRIFRASDPSNFHGPSNPLTSLYGGTNKQTIEQASAWFDGWSEAGEWNWVRTQS